nr:MAG: RNA-dependent RNA polymerase [Botourmiaviridae sp.]
MASRLSKDSAGRQSLLRETVSQLKTHLDFTTSLTGLKCPELPGFKTIDEIKAFTGLIDSTTDHPWRDWWTSIKPEKVAYSFAHSLFLFRKVLPSGSKAEALKSFLSKMSKPAPKADPKFLEHIDREICRLFPKGWDRGYSQAARSLCLSTSSCIENSRSNSGARNASTLLSRLSFQRAIGVEPFQETGHFCKVVPIQDGCKWRVVTVNSAQCEALKPWHKIMYNHLSKKSWLCRGSPNVKGFHRKEGEIFVSGDYESATDAIPTKIYLAMLGALCRQSDNIPDSVKEFALHESRKVFVDDQLNTIGYQRRGQLMGSYLSFPFLCLLNYLCFTFSIKRSVPLLINGDDIVFRCREEEKDRWMENVRRSGLVLSRGKTLCHESIFTLNSTLFRGGKDAGKAVGFFRPKAYFKCPSSGSAAAGQFSSLVVGFPGSPAKDRIQIGFLKRYSSLLMKKQWPLRAGLGFRVSDRVLRQSGFYDHERFYGGLGVRAQPIPGLIPGGFVKRPLPKQGGARRDARVSERLFFQEMVELSWLPRRKDEAEEPIGPFRYVRPLTVKPGLSKWIRLLKGGRNHHLKIGEEERKKRETYWRNVRGPRPRSLRFCFAGWSTGNRVEPELLVFKGRLTAKA